MDLSENVKIYPEEFLVEFEKKLLQDVENHINKKHYPEAINGLQKLISLNPNFALYHSLLGKILLKKGWERYAMEEFEISLTLDPDDKIANKYFRVLPEEKSQSTLKKFTDKLFLKSDTIEETYSEGLIHKIKKFFDFY